MIRILKMGTFQTLRTSPEPAPKAALKRYLGWDPEPKSVEKKNCILRWTKRLCSAFKSGLCDVVQIRWRFLTSVCFLEICHRSPCTTGIKDMFLLHMITSEFDRVSGPNFLSCANFWLDPDSWLWFTSSDFLIRSKVSWLCLLSW